MVSNMPEAQRYPGSVPHPEPLSQRSNDAEKLKSLHASSSIPPSAPLSGPTSSLSVPKQTWDNNLGRLMRDITASLKLRLVLQNRGSVARDHLASERTYLAYVRTSLACASAGVALVQLLTLNVSTQEKGVVDLEKFAKPLGATIILFGLVILALGFFRYFTTQSALVRGCFPAARISITMIALVLGALVGVVFGILLAGTRG